MEFERGVADAYDSQMPIYGYDLPFLQERRAGQHPRGNQSNYDTIEV